MPNRAAFPVKLIAVCGPEDALACAERIRKGIAALSLSAASGPLRFTVSIDVAVPDQDLHTGPHCCSRGSNVRGEEARPQPHGAGAAPEPMHGPAATGDRLSCGAVRTKTDALRYLLCKKASQIFVETDWIEVTVACSRKLFAHLIAIICGKISRRTNDEH